MKLTLIMVLVMLSGPAVYAQAGSDLALPVGTAIDRVVIPADPSQSYAAYIPTTYSPNSPSAVIYCFDPVARGKFALERFQTGAEKYGYIVVCSNNSHNGQESETAARVIAAMENDVRRRFNIDPARIYAAGFSGGARLAISLAVTCGKCVAGVIAAGAGFPPSIKPNAKLPFSFFGAVGVDDFNYDEMRELQAKLEKLAVNHRMKIFTGGHEWMDPATAEEALAWFNLQAMNRGLTARDHNFLDEQFNLRRRGAEQDMSDTRPIDRYYEYLTLIRDFSERPEIQGIRAAVTKYADTPMLKKTLRDEKELAGRRERETEDLFRAWLEISEIPSAQLSNGTYVRKEVAKLRQASEGALDIPERRLARRVLSGAFVGALETARPMIQRKHYGTAAQYYELAFAIQPKNAGIGYELARAYALDGQKREALRVLETAVTAGFKDWDRMRKDLAFTDLAADSRFQKLLQQAP